MSKTSANLKKYSGILLHPTALPSKRICGGFGQEARSWVKLLSENGIGAWQFLPLSPTDSTGSPYSSPSGFALNPWFLDENDLVHDGFLTIEKFKELPGSVFDDSSRFDNFKLANIRSRKLGEALRESWNSQNAEAHIEFNNWKEKQWWLSDHALFMEIRFQNNLKPWWEWPKNFANYNRKVLDKYEHDHRNQLLEHFLIQWHLFRQWKKIRLLAKELDVLLFGDLPFYVSRDSSDVWANRSLFSVLSDGELLSQSGVPPDYFSSTGQLWGNPVYRWQRHKLSKFRWWRKRFARQFEQVDLLRIDHFRAFNAFWNINGIDKTAQRGYWSPSPGLQILSLLRKQYGKKIPLAAEDLGIITPDVERLRDHFDLPGMKILQFAFDGNLDNPYLPENINNYKSIVYTGTHDNSTTNGWWNEIDENTKLRVYEKLSSKEESSPAWMLIDIGLSTKSCLFISPLQDLLDLDNHARFNTPGTVSDNWSWRINDFDEKLLNALSKYGKLAISRGRSSQGIFSLIQ